MASLPGNASCERLIDSTQRNSYNKKSGARDNPGAGFITCESVTSSRRLFSISCFLGFLALALGASALASRFGFGFRGFALAAGGTALAAGVAGVAAVAGVAGASGLACAKAVR